MMKTTVCRNPPLIGEPEYSEHPSGRGFSQLYPCAYTEDLLVVRALVLLITIRVLLMMNGWCTCEQAVTVLGQQSDHVSTCL